MRVFAASSIERFEGVQELFEDLSGIKSCKPVKTPHLHLTFRFFGELAGKTLEKTRETFRQIEGRKYSLQIHGVSAFPNLQTANVLFLRVENNEEIVSNWNAISSLPPAEINRKSFIPHITVGRFRSGFDSRELCGKYEKLGFAQVCSYISLFRSDLGREGPIYKEIERIQLK